MGSFTKAHGIDVTVHVKAADTGCSNPCHPAHACRDCQPFWQHMHDTGRFSAYEPTTFAGPKKVHKNNLGAPKVDVTSQSYLRKANER